MSSTLIDRVVEQVERTSDPVAEVTIQLLITANKHGAESLPAAAITRLVRAILTAVSNHPSGLMKVVAAPSDLQAMLVFLEDPAVIEELARLDPLAPAVARGILRRAELYQSEGGCVSGDEAATYIHVSRQALDKARKEGKVLALPRGGDGWTYPIWQFKKGRYLPGLSTVLDVLEPHGPFVQASFLLSPHSRLDGQTPLSYLLEENIQPVIDVAKEFGQHGG